VERIGHRGAKREFPENTVQAFARAFERGANAVELDVHTTRDGVVVVHHDPTIGGMAMGRPKRSIAELDWCDVEAVDLGNGSGIPTLSAVLAVVPPEATTYVELKGQGVEEAVANVLLDSPKRCAVHSFDHAAVARMEKLLPDVPRGILLEDRSQDVAAAMRVAAARDVWPDWKLIDRALVDLVHGAGGRVIAWTVNSRSVAEELAALGVDGICTDDVRILNGL
jgi:glycerophosphoryl diester phosphodiesterase